MLFRGGGGERYKRRKFEKMSGKNPKLCPFTGPFWVIPQARLYFLEYALHLSQIYKKNYLFSSHDNLESSQLKGKVFPAD